MEDLSKEAVYAHQKTSVSGEWEREIAGWTLEERERELAAMRLQEVAEMTRMRSVVEGFARRMREAEGKAGIGRGGSAGLGEKEKVGNPYGAKGKEREGREKEVVGGKEGKGWGQGKAGSEIKEVKGKGESLPAPPEKVKAVGKEKKTKEEKEKEKKATGTTSLAERMARMWGKA